MISCQTSSPKKDIWQITGRRRVCVCPERGHGYQPERFTELCFSLADFSLKQRHLCARRSGSDPRGQRENVLRCNRKVKCKSCQTFLVLFKDDLLSSPTPPVTEHLKEEGEGHLRSLFSETGGSQKLISD